MKHLAHFLAFGNGFSHSSARSLFLWLAFAVGLLVVGWYARRAIGHIISARGPGNANRAQAKVLIIGPKVWISAVLCGLGLVGIGWLLHDVQEYHSTYVLANAAVESQQDVYLSYHYVDDPQRQSYGIKFCNDYVPDLQPRQIIEVMIYVRKHGCESIAAYKSGLKIRRLNGVPILEGGN